MRDALAPSKLILLTCCYFIFFKWLIQIYMVDAGAFVGFTRALNNLHLAVVDEVDITHHIKLINSYNASSSRRRSNISAESTHGKPKRKFSFTWKFLQIKFENKTIYRCKLETFAVFVYFIFIFGFSLSLSLSVLLHYINTIWIH